MRLATLWCAVTLGVASAHSAPIVTVDLDAFAVGTVLDHAFPGLTLSVLGVASRSVVAMDGFSASIGRNIATTGSLVFAAFPLLGPDHPTATVQGWESDFRTLRIDFQTLTDFVSIDFIADDEDVGELRAVSPTISSLSQRAPASCQTNLQRQQTPPRHATLRTSRPPGSHRKR